MAKQVAVVAVNPVNGAGLFQYLEAFYENGIPYRVFAVSDTPDIRTNSGIALHADDVIAALRGEESAYDALVFACGDAIPRFAGEADAPYNRDLLEVIRTFSRKGKLLIGHCAAGMLFDLTGAVPGRKVAVHPLAKGAVQNADATDTPCEIDGPVCTAQTETTLPGLIAAVVEKLKA